MSDDKVVDFQERRRQALQARNEPIIPMLRGLADGIEKEWTEEERGNVRVIVLLQNKDDDQAITLVACQGYTKPMDAVRCLEDMSFALRTDMCFHDSDSDDVHGA